MSVSITNSAKQTHTPHHVLIGAPLILILLFCFSFVLLQPTQPGLTRSSATKTPGPTGAVAGVNAELPPIKLAQTELTTLETAAPAETPALAASGAAPTSTPQTAKSAGAAKSANPQTSSARGQQINHNTIINLPKAQVSVPSLTNFLR